LRCRPIATLVAIAPAPAHALVKSQGRCLIGRAQVGARLLKQTPMALRRVLAPKLGGAGNLAALTPCAPVAWAATFSSVSALAGFAGHANYCAANAAADALAAARPCSPCSGAPGLPWVRPDTSCACTNILLHHNTPAVSAPHGLSTPRRAMPGCVMQLPA